MNFVPFKEIALLLVQYQRAQSESTVRLLCEFLIATVAESEKYLVVFREVGILNLFIKTINAFAIACKTYPETLLPLDPSQQTAVAFEIQLSESHITNFGFITDVLVNLIRNSQNQTLFRLGTNRALYDCLQNDQLQQDAIKVVRVSLLFIIVAEF